jgi:hypothetical protein
MSHHSHQSHQLIPCHDHSNQSAAGPHYVHHKYPFLTLGHLLSHAHLHFAIYNTGKKIAGKIGPLDNGK